MISVEVVFDDDDSGAEPLEVIAKRFRKIKAALDVIASKPDQTEQHETPEEVLVCALHELVGAAVNQSAVSVPQLQVKAELLSYLLNTPPENPSEELAHSLVRDLLGLSSL